MAWLVAPTPAWFGVGVAVAASVPAVVVLGGLIGPADSAADWVAYSGPVGLGLAVLAVQIRAVLGMVVLLVTTAVGLMPAFDLLEQRSGTLTESALFILTYVAICFVTCTTGARTGLVVSSVLIVAWVVVVVWRDDVDVPLLMVSLGWWAVGRVVRSRRIVADRLRLRVDELAVEQARFAAEAVRLERAKIARELHDVVAHCMTVIVIQAQAGRQVLTRDPAAAAEALDAIISSAQEAEDDIAALVALMDPDQARPLTRTLLDELVTRAAATGTTVDLALTGNPDDLAPAVAVATHRAVQECLTNAFRHAPGAAISIELSCTPYGLVVQNRPESGPAAVPAPGGGHGLVGLSERMAALGLTATYGPTPTGGWRVAVRPARVPTGSPVEKTNGTSGEPDVPLVMRLPTV